MKDIKTYINENYKGGWEYFSDVTLPSTEAIDLPGLDKKEVKWIQINTETESISAITERDLKQWTDDYEGDDTGEKAVKALKVGESYDSDGGINIYVRIK